MTEIVECGRTMAGNFVAFDIRWAGELPDQVPVLWAMEVSSEDGRESVRLGHVRTGGQFVAQFVLDHVTGERQEVEGDADVGDDEITVRFPASTVGVAVEWPVWKAVLLVDGEQVSSQVASG